MHPMEHIRRNILVLTQADMGDVAGVNQATVSRWENGEAEPDRDEMARIREFARKRKIDWDDGWFFSVPKAKAPA